VIRDSGGTDTLEKNNKTEKMPIYKIGNPYFINGVRYIPREEKNYYAIGIASWYGPNFHGKYTANGEIFDQYDITAAHKTLPLPSIVKVTNMENSRELIVRINDRGPFIGNRIIDLSLKSAQLLGIEKKGTAKVKIELMDYGPHLLTKNKKLIVKNTDKQKIFYIQVGAFINANNADKLAQKLRNEGYILNKVSIKTVNSEKRTLYIVRIGPIKNKEDLLYVKRNLERNNINSKIIQEPS
jgi:rare lipoprotein A